MARDRKSDDEFVRVWELSTRVWQVAETLGITEAAAKFRAKALRKRGVKLKRLADTPRRPVEVDFVYPENEADREALAQTINAFAVEAVQAFLDRVKLDREDFTKQEWSTFIRAFVAANLCGKLAERYALEAVLVAVARRKVERQKKEPT